MSAIEQALRKIDLQRERNPSAAGVQPPQPMDMSLRAPRAAVRSGRRWWLLALLLGILAASLAAAAWFSLRPDGGSQTVKPMPTAAAAMLPAPQAQSALIMGVPAFQPESASAPTTLPTASAAPPRAAWLVQASQAWDSGAWEHASRLWTDGLRRTAPSVLALQIADFQTLEQAQRLHQTWSREWPVVILAQASSAGPLWMVLALPNAADVDTAQQRLSQTLGISVAWASVAQWVVRAEVGQAMMSSAPAAAPALAAVAPVAPAHKEARIEKHQAVASTPAAVPAHATTNLASTVASPPQVSAEVPQVSRSNGATPDDQARAVMATKAIDVDFSAVEQWLAKAEFDKALGGAERLEGYIGANWRTRYLAGVALSGLGRWNEAVSALSSARQKNPGHARVALYMAVALQETGDHTGAIETLLKATSSHPDVPELWLNQGHSLQAQGRTEEAAHAYKRFLDLSATRNDLSQQRSWVTKRLQREI